MRLAPTVLILSALVFVACGDSADPNRGSGGDSGVSTDPNCGNAVLDPGETCDPTIAAGQPGACPTSCDDGIACTTDTSSGAAGLCTFACFHTAVVECVNNDGCCPAGCNQNSDSDCSATCGNGQIEPRETCDGNCPADCNDLNACTNESLVGAASSCSAVCTVEAITACAGGDGCCAPGCNSQNDSDCSASCGNGTVEATETCDGNCPSTCDDNDVCTKDIVAGSAASCSLSCSNRPISTCEDDDGCCPSGCNSGSDNDCPSTCGNSQIDPGETCESGVPDFPTCPTSCPPPSDACVQSTMLIGDATRCNTQCVSVPVTACTGGDGCCAPGCTAVADSDCAPPAAALGDACTQSSDCSPHSDCLTELGVTSPPVSMPGGYCSTACGSGGTCPENGICQFFDDFPRCYKPCTTNADCRSGYTCTNYFAGPTVCLPPGS